MGILSVPATLWSIGRKVENFLAAQDEITEALRALNVRVRALEDRTSRLEMAHDRLVAEAQAAASAATTTVVGAVFSDIITRVTRIEMRLGDGVGRLPSAASGP